MSLSVCGGSYMELIDRLADRVPKTLGENPSTVFATLSSFMLAALLLLQEATLPGGLDMALEVIVILCGAFTVGYAVGLATGVDHYSCELRE